MRRAAGVRHGAAARAHHRHCAGDGHPEHGHPDRPDEVLVAATRGGPVGGRACSGRHVHADTAVDRHCRPRGEETVIGRREEGEDGRGDEGAVGRPSGDDT